MAGLLSLTVVFSLLAIAFPSVNALEVYTNIPTVYIEGQGGPLGIPNGDGTYKKIYGIEIPGASLGATVGTVDEDLSDDYIASVVLKGKSTYISPDKKVDASTCLYPEKTWFIKNLEHKEFPDSVNCLMVEMINNPDFNINSNEKYPQFMVYDTETLEIVPMTAENEDTTARWDVTFWDALKKFFESLVGLIKELSATE